MKDQDSGRFWGNLWKITSLLNVFVAVLFVLFFGKGVLSYDGDIKASDLVVIVLASVTVILAALALVLGGLAVWGFAEIRRSAETAATIRAEQIAIAVGRDVAEAATTRYLFERDRRTSESLQSADDVPRPDEPTGTIDDLSMALTMAPGK